MTINTALIAEYLALITTLEFESPAADYRRANQLAYQLAMELPIDMWRAIYAAAVGTNGKPIWEAISVARLFNGLGRELTINDAVHHAPGAGQKPGDLGANVTAFPFAARAAAQERAQAPEQPQPPEPSPTS